LRRDPPYPKEVVLQHPEAGRSHHPDKASWSGLFHGTNLHRTIVASVPWFLQDLGTYGIGIFTPTMLATIIGARVDHPRNTAELIQSDILATKGAAFIDVLLIVGIVFAVLLADRVGRISLQILGFIGCAVGLLLAALSLHVGGGWSGVLLFVGFMTFSFMTRGLPQRTAGAGKLQHPCFSWAYAIVMLCTVASNGHGEATSGF